MISGSPPTERKARTGAVDAADEEFFGAGEDFARAAAGELILGCGAVIGRSHFEFSAIGTL